MGVSIFQSLFVILLEICRQASGHLCSWCNWRWPADHDGECGLMPAPPVCPHLFACVRQDTMLKSKVPKVMKTFQFTISRKRRGPAARQHSDAGSLSQHPQLTGWNSLLRANLFTLWRGRAFLLVGDLPLITEMEQCIFYFSQRAGVFDTNKLREGKDRSQRTCFRQDIWTLHTDQDRLLGHWLSPHQTQACLVSNPQQRKSREKELL